MSDCDVPNLEEYPGGGPPKDPTDPTDPPIDGTLPTEPDPPVTRYDPTGPYSLNDFCAELKRVGGMHPQLLDGLFMNMIADHFTNPAYIWAEPLKDKIWDEDPLKTKIQIYTVSDFDPSQPPGPLTVVVDDADIDIQRYVIGDLYDVHVDGYEFSRRVVGTQTFLATGGSGAEAKYLAWELNELFTSSARILMDLGIFSDFEVVKVAKMGILDSTGNAISKPVSVRYQFLTNYIVRPIAPIAKKVDLDIQPRL